MAEPAEIVSIPIRPDLIIRIAHIPFDLTEAEALKISRVITAYAVPTSHKDSQ